MAKLAYNNVANRFEATTDDGAYFVSIHADEYGDICAEAVQAGNPEQEVDTAEFWTDKEHQDWSQTIICKNVLDLDTRTDEDQAELDEDARLSDIEAEIAASGEDPYPARRMGRPPYDDQEPKERVQVMLEPVYIQRLTAAARQKGTTISALARTLIIMGLERHV